jgi:hypothetical protein
MPLRLSCYWYNQGIALVREINVLSSKGSDKVSRPPPLRLSQTPFESMGSHPPKTLKAHKRKKPVPIAKRLAQIYVSYNVPLDFPDGISCFTAVSAAKLSRSADFSTTGESMIADPCKVPSALASSTVDKDGVTVGLVPDDALLVPNVSDFFIRAAL